MATFSNSLSTSGREKTVFHIPDYILDDLSSRFIINIPEDERSDLIRIFFQIELAHWFYIDFYCADNAALKNYGIKEFSYQLFNHCPTLADYARNFDQILDTWREYKMSVPTYGAILMDSSMEHCLLVQGFWSRAGWGFPKGKVNQDESPVDCAVREVLEETGFDMSHLINESEYIEYQLNEQQLSRLYLVPGVSMETKFQPRTRKEIRNLEWFKIGYLPSHKKDNISKMHYNLPPNAFFMVIPFVRSLRKWVNKKLNRTVFDDVDGDKNYRERPRRYSHSDAKITKEKIDSWTDRNFFKKSRDSHLESTGRGNQRHHSPFRGRGKQLSSPRQKSNSRSPSVGHSKSHRARQLLETFNLWEEHPGHMEKVEVRMWSDTWDKFKLDADALLQPFINLKKPQQQHQAFRGGHKPNHFRHDRSGQYRPVQYQQNAPRYK